MRLTPTEETERCRKLARLTGELEEAEAVARRVAAELRRKRMELESEMSLLARIVRQGEEERSVTVYVVADFGRGVAEHLRADTLEVMPAKTRPLRVEERQSRLFGESPPMMAITVTAEECESKGEPS